MHDVHIELQRAKRILEISHQMTSTKSLESLLDQIVEAAVELTDSSSAGILLLSEQERMLHFTTVSGSAGALTGIPVPIENSIAGYVFSTGKAIIVSDVDTDPRYYAEVAEKIGIKARSLMAAPLQFQGRRIGVLEVENKCLGQEFDQNDLDILGALAAHATIAIDNTQLYQQLEQHRDHLQELVDDRTSELKQSMAEAEILNQQLAQEIEEREALITDLEAFSHTVAHDLKNPLGLIIGYSQLLLRKLVEHGDVELLQLAEPISQTGERMNRIITELLTLASVRQQDISPYPLHMNAVLALVKDRLNHMIADSGAIITQPENWPLALGYAPWIEEVWVNYVSNAIKYGGAPPHLTLGASVMNFLTPGGTEHQHVRFWIQDNGKGIAPDVQSQLFGKFTRFDKTRAHGHGLGLSIVKRIIEKLGGQVGVESTPGQGSAFFFTLPAAEIDHPSSPGLDYLLNTHTANAADTPPLLLTLPKRMSVLDPSLTTALSYAVDRGDVERIRALIAQIGEHDSILGAVLDRMAYNFDYDGISELIGKTSKQHSTT